MNARTQILSAIRRQTLDDAPLPDLAQPAIQAQWTTYADRQAQFAEMLQVVGGHCVVVDAKSQINGELEQIPAYCQASKICSLIEDVGATNVDLATVRDPHDTEDLDFAIVPGQFAVAENGAVWVTDQGLTHRAALFIAQHLVLIVPATEIVDNMHQAYDRLTFREPGFGVFISGPSKTADIEQSLVIGAHGPRSLTVFLTAS